MMTVPHRASRLKGGVAVFLAIAGLWTATRGVAAQQSAVQSDVSVKDVQTILEKNCYSCHTEKMRGGLRLDSREAILKGGATGPAVVPGKPEASLLYQAISYTNEDLKMPPNGQLARDEVAAIARWIKADALMPAVEVASKKSPGIASAQAEFFETKVRPLLASKCYSCHTQSQSGGLRLDSRDAMMKGGKDGSVVDLSSPDASLLLKAVHYQDAALQMPPAKQMEPAEIAVLEEWIKGGAFWPSGASKPAGMQVTAKDREFWAYKVPVKPTVPTVSGRWAYNDLDRFVLTSLKANKLQPVRDADKRTLQRRVTFDLTGLPPTPQEVSEFLADKSRDAYPRLVERLLASKAYGERWGRIWLDVVRYSDTSSNTADYPIPDIYKYRDYVVKSFIEDKPYDRFIREQIAGDLLPAATEAEHWQNVIATGYLADTNITEDPISDAVDNIGHAFLATTVACARCHDHKFDPIPTSDYYGIYGVLASTHFATTGTEEVRYQRGLIYRDPKATESQEYKDFEEQLKPIADSIHAVIQLPYFDDILPLLQARRMALFQNAPHFETAYAVSEDKPHNERIQHYGSKKDLGDEVPRHFLQVLGNSDLPSGTKGSGRLEMANWIASPQNPVTARVMVNRIWQGHFGRGIVATPNDFGSRGAAPSDQQLLDYLATQFVEKGWSIKAIHRMILLSHTYQLSSEDSPEDERIDAENKYLWRHSRTRMDAEEIRDAMLATSGKLDTSPAGPQPFPPEYEWNYSGHAPFHAVYETNRRTLYVMAQRSRRHPYLGLFDGANPSASVATRETSVTPLQALYFMNASFPKDCASALAKQIDQTALSDKEKIRAAFLRVYGRPSDEEETDAAIKFVQQTEAIYITHGPSDAHPNSTGAHLQQVSAGAAAGGQENMSVAQNKAWAHTQALGNLIQALYASNEFMFLD
jgi:mono/diheme cytochrome c family protein